MTDDPTGSETNPDEGRVRAETTTREDGPRGLFLGDAALEYVHDLREKWPGRDRPTDHGFPSQKMGFWT